jgi:hypothetical protein
MEMWFINSTGKNTIENNMDYQIAIPSYKRAETLRDKTLALLQKYNIPPEKIHIFVANEEERSVYAKTLPDYYKEIVVGVVGMMAIRNYIQDYFAEGERVLNIDDDIQALKVRVNDKECKELEDLDKLILDGFELCEKHSCSLWGIYPLVNAMFMHDDISFSLQYIIGAFWGVVNTHDKNTYVTLDDKEDFERSIKFYIKDGAVVRFNNIGVLSAYYTEPGGMQVERTEKRVRHSGIELLLKYPMFCAVNKARKRHFEIRLVDKTKRR